MAEVMKHCTHCGAAIPDDARFCPGCGQAIAVAGDALAGQVLAGRYRLLEKIGQGASGTLYRGEHATLGRRVAIKVLHQQLCGDERALERFRREATTVAELDNEHIVQVLDFARTDDGRLFIAMELLEGVTLSAELERAGRLPVARVVDILGQTAEALVEAHGLGYVHRDLRPRNIFLVQRRGRADFVKLLDFGLSKLVLPDGGPQQTVLGMSFGDPRYMSPEQARGDALDRRADIYSLGVIAFEMLTGAPPYTGSGTFEVLQRHMDAAVPHVRARRADCPAWLDAAVHKALAKRADERFPTVLRLAEALRAPATAAEVGAAAPAAAASTAKGPALAPATAKVAAAAAKEAAGDVGKGTLELTSLKHLADAARGDGGAKEAGAPRGVAAGPAPGSPAGAVAATTAAAANGSTTKAVAAAASPAAVAVVAAPAVGAPAGAGAKEAATGVAAAAPASSAAAAPAAGAAASGAAASAAAGAAASSAASAAAAAAAAAAVQAPVAGSVEVTPAPMPARDAGHVPSVVIDGAAHERHTPPPMAHVEAQGDSRAEPTGEWFSTEAAHGSDGFEDEYEAPERSRAPLIIGGVAGGLIVLGAAAIAVMPKSTPRATAANPPAIAAKAEAPQAKAVEPAAEDKKETPPAEAKANPPPAETKAALPTEVKKVEAPPPAEAKKAEAPPPAEAKKAEAPAVVAKAETPPAPPPKKETAPPPAEAKKAAPVEAKKPAQVAMATPGKPEPATPPRKKPEPAGALPHKKPIDEPAAPPPAPKGAGDAQAEFFIKLGRQKLGSNDLTAAAANFNKAREFDARSAEAMAGLGEVAFEQGDYNGASVHLRQAVKLAPGRARYFVLLGQAYYKLNRPRDAATEYKRALRLDPANQEAQHSLELAERKLTGGG